MLKTKVQTQESLRVAVVFLFYMTPAVHKWMSRGIIQCLLLCSHHTGMMARESLWVKTHLNTQITVLSVTRNCSGELLILPGFLAIVPVWYENCQPIPLPLSIPTNHCWDFCSWRLNLSYPLIRIIKPGSIRDSACVPPSLSSLNLDIHFKYAHLQCTFSRLVVWFYVLLHILQH